MRRSKYSHSKYLRNSTIIITTEHTQKLVVLTQNTKIMAHNQYPSEKLDMFKNKINELIQKTKPELERLNEEWQSHGSRDHANQSYGEDGKADQILSRLAAMTERKANYLQKLHAALLRIENGTFGIDVDTGQLIDERRLLIDPTVIRDVQGVT